MAAECFYIVTARLHYTVDVMLAIYLCFAVWWAYMPNHWGSDQFFVWWEIGATRSGDSQATRGLSIVVTCGVKSPATGGRFELANMQPGPASDLVS